ncbi:MAG: alpha/beta hydrolase [Candidatus Heimdallarchaeota archaeon]|nr:alpha/beta hydrolase [Candidatus Heimdallarchaeota archaeon]
MVSLCARFFVGIMKLMSMKNHGFLDIEKSRKDLENQVFLFKTPRNVKVEQVLVEELSAEWLRPKDCQTDRVIIYLHGGSYNAGSLRTHRGLAARIGKSANSLVLSLDYRLAPENPFPAAVTDVVLAYKWLIEKEGFDPKKVMISGDSSGGGLVLSALLKIKEDQLPFPAAAICLSPWTDLANTGDSIKTKAKVEIMLTEEELKQSAEIYAKNEDVKHPLISPLYADLAGLPPILIQTGTAEMLLDDSIRFVHKAEEAKVLIELDLWDNMFHVFQIFGNLIPESKKAIVKIGEFAKANFS